jgi:Ni,Fe-hydrogenase I small subunit
LKFGVGTIINSLKQAIERMTAALKVADDVNVSWVHRTSCHGSTGRYTSAAEGACAPRFLVSVLDSTVY